MYVITTKKVKGFINNAEWIIDISDICKTKKEAITMFLGEFTQYKKKHIIKIEKIR